MTTYLTQKKAEKTLKIWFIPLFLISFNVYATELSDKIISCTKALSVADTTQALKISTEILKSEPNNRDGLLCKGRALGAQGNYKEALAAFEQGAQQSKQPFEQIIDHLLIGNLHKDNKQYQAALASYEKSLALCLQQDNQKYTHINYLLIGETHALNNNLEAAITNYKLSEKIAMNDNERADSQERLANTYSALGKHDLAIENQIRAVLLQKRSGTLDQNANAMAEMGRIYYVAKEYQNAERAYGKLNQFAKENGGAYFETKANIGIAQAKLALGDSATAKTLLSDAQSTAKSIGADDLVAEINALQVKIN